MVSAVGDVIFGDQTTRELPSAALMGTALTAARAERTTEENRANCMMTIRRDGRVVQRKE